MTLSAAGAKGSDRAGDSEWQPGSNPAINSKAREYRPLVVGYYKGAVVHLTDVANVVDSQQTVRQAGFLNGKPSVNIIIFRQPGANIIQTVDAVKAALPSLQASIIT